MLLKLLMYFLISCKSDWRDTLLVTIVIPKGSEWMKSTRTLDFVFLRVLLILVICNEEFFMKLEMLSLPMGMMICFLEEPLVVI